MSHKNVNTFVTTVLCMCRRTAVALSLIVVGLSVPALAHSTLKEAVIRAQEHIKLVQDVPIFRKEIVSSGLISLEDFGPYRPHFSHHRTGINHGIHPGFGRSRGIYVDGIYVDDIYVDGIYADGIYVDGTDGIYVDGIYYRRGHHRRGYLSRIPHIDLGHIGMLRRPQSVPFGKTTVAGRPNVQTTRPTLR